VHGLCMGCAILYLFCHFTYKVPISLSFLLWISLKLVFEDDDEIKQIFKSGGSNFHKKEGKFLTKMH
jgi:hypothetical protein